MQRTIFNVGGIWVLIIVFFNESYCTMSSIPSRSNVSNLHTLETPNEDSSEYRNGKKVVQHEEWNGVPVDVNQHLFDLSVCHRRCNGGISGPFPLLMKSFDCECRHFDWHNRIPTCIQLSWICDGWADCEDGSDELDCICAENEFQCNGCDCGCGCEENAAPFSLYQCIRMEDVGDEVFDCYSWNDEPEMWKLAEKANTLCSDDFANSQCNGVLDCPKQTPHDEANCTGCPSNRPNRCNCNKEGNMTCRHKGQRTCYSDDEKCDRNADCADSTDELGCPTCSDEEFTCKCYHEKYTMYDYDEACIPKEKYLDGKEDCPDGSDEPELKKNLLFGECNVTLYRFNDIEECTESTFSTPCDKSTCFNTSSYLCSVNDCNMTDVICSSSCAENADEQGRTYPVFQCSDYNLVLASQFCDGKIDCPDSSDEIRHQPGFKCTRSQDECVMPQPNLHDNIAHCDNAHDICNDNNSCFECFDGRLWIASEQVCDSVIDCYDLSDECLCKSNIKKPNCDAIFNLGYPTSKLCTFNTITSKVIQNLLTKHPSLTHTLLQGDTSNSLKNYLRSSKSREQNSHCITKHGVTIPRLCDGRPECRDFSDECDNCENPPSFCDDTCFSFYPLGDRYCDGVIDEAWMFINNTSCPRGFDEQACPGRFYCKSGDKVSIDISSMCDGIVDCDDKSDERKCSTFLSDTEMIANPVLRSAFWIIGVVVIMGNIFVIVTTLRTLRISTSTDMIRFQHVIILNISCADFIMGIYLITIAFFSQIYSGSYGLVDVEWRTSLRCCIIGSLAVISSESSCFLIVTLTALRLYGVCKPFATTTASTMPWKMAISCSWLISIILGILPIPHRTLHYFMHSVFFPNQFNTKGVWSKASLSKFACRFAALKNLTIKNEGSEWDSTRNFIESNFPKNSPLKEFGYYGRSSVCMPRFYVQHGANAWEYTFAIITINFLAFVFIAACYILIYFLSKKQAKKVHKNKKKLSKQDSKMQKRIARIITTDFVCWIPICIMSYARVSGLEIPFLVYQISAVFLLPINSALNPFLYSSLPDKLMEKLFYCKKKQ